jgi:hypothetical protein
VNKAVAAVRTLECYVGSISVPIINQHALFFTLLCCHVHVHVWGPFIAHNQEADCTCFNSKSSVSGSG